MDVWDAIRNKRAVRNFTSEPLKDEHLQRILDAGRRAQSSKNSQPWQFIVVRDSQTLEKVSQMGDYLKHVAGAAACVVICIPHEDPEERGDWHFFDAGQSAAYMQLAAQELGVGSCLGTIYDQQAAHSLLNVPPGWQARLLISFGYPAEQQRPGQGKAGRRQFDDVVHWDRW